MRVDAVANYLFSTRVFGSKIQVAGWTAYVTLIASFKLSMLAFYVRLMVRLLMTPSSRGTIAIDNLMFDRTVLADGIAFQSISGLAWSSGALLQVLLRS